MDETMLKTLYKSQAPSEANFGLWRTIIAGIIASGRQCIRPTTKMKTLSRKFKKNHKLEKPVRPNLGLRKAAQEALPTNFYRRKREDLIQVYKIRHRLNDMPKEELFGMAIGIVDTRGHNLKIFRRRSILKLRSHSFTNRIVNSWNCLPASRTEWIRTSARYVTSLHLA